MVRRYSLAVRFGVACALLFTACGSIYAANEGMAAKMWSDPLTRYIHVTYRVPSSAPDEVTVTCSWSPAGKNDWKPARITPLISETGLTLASDAEKDSWIHGRTTERRAAGLERTVVFDPYPEAQSAGKVDADFRIEIATPAGEKLDTETVHLQADNTDVVYLTKWENVLQNYLVAKTATDGKWLIGKDGAVTAKDGTPLPALTYPLDLKGSYAIFVATDPETGPIALRLSGDERTENLSSSNFEKETLWRWTQMDHQHLVFKQKHYFTGYVASSLRYVKLVPLSKSLESSMNAKFTGKHDKFLAAYFEPYSWSFYNDIRENYQHREPMSAYQEAGADLVDTQLARFGMKAVFETRKSDQLIYSTEGDPIAGVVPTTDNVGRMQQYTNMYGAELKYAKEMGFALNANFGATNCYPGTPLNSDFCEKHPGWRKENTLCYDVPEVRAYILSMYREALEIGAPGISIDYCRYPEGIESAATCTAFMRDLRKLADEFGTRRGKHVPILVRFPAKRATRWEYFDYRIWAREGLVDFLCPSNITGVHQFFDVKPYVEATRGTKCKVTPVIDAITWGPAMPGLFLSRVKQIYEMGADGIYIYQADDPVVYHPEKRKYVTLARSTEAVDRWWKADATQRLRCSKGIYLSRSLTGKGYGYWERVQIWAEGIRMGELETYLDGKLIGKFAGPPYLLGTDGDESNKVVPMGEHVLLVRARDGNGWLEQTFKINGAE